MFQKKKKEKKEKTVVQWCVLETDKVFKRNMFSYLELTSDRGVS